jgi:hypothetical protein
MLAQKKSPRYINNKFALNQKVLALLSLMRKITSYLHYGWSVNLLAIENGICGIHSIEHNMRPILRTV